MNGRHSKELSRIVSLLYVTLLLEIKMTALCVFPGSANCRLETAEQLKVYRWVIVLWASALMTLDVKRQSNGVKSFKADPHANYLRNYFHFFLKHATSTYTSDLHAVELGLLDYWLFYFVLLDVFYVLYFFIIEKWG